MYYSKLYDLDSVISCLEHEKDYEKADFVRFEIDESGAVKFNICGYDYENKPFNYNRTEEHGLYLADTVDERDFDPLNHQYNSCKYKKGYYGDYTEIINNKSGTIKYKCTAADCENYNCPHFC